MTELATAFMGIFAPSTAAPVVGGAVTQGVVQTAGSGLTLAKLLSGTATVLGMFNEISAGKADAEAATLAAIDAEREKPLETLQGINRRAALKQDMMDKVGQQDVAYAASGVDLSFGTPGQARRDAFREGDRALTNDVATEQTRVARLDERAANYRKRAARAKASGLFSAATTGLSGLSRLSGIGG